MPELTTAAARRLAIHCQGLNGGWKLAAGKEGSATIVDRLGYVQIDTISVIERAHDHVVGTRQRGYASEMLQELLVDRRVFEYWAHAAAYVPFSDYRYYLPKMRACADGTPIQKYREANGKLMREVRRRIEREGPLSTSDFEHKQNERGPWWDWKPAKRALEVLFDMGELMVTARDRFRRVYDLAERVIPPGIDTSEPSAEETARHFARRALQVHGVASVKQVRKMFANRGAPPALKAMVSEGEVVEVRVEGTNESYYALPESLECVPRRLSNRVQLLSPFDNLVIDRDRLEALFDFLYKIECYTPAAKRRYGYFTLPILWKGRLVGRLDPKAERKAKRFVVRKVVLEPACRDTAALARDLAAALRAFAKFNSCEEIRVEHAEPASFKKALERELRKAE